MSLIPSWVKVLVACLLAALAIAACKARDAGIREEGRAEVRAQVTAERAQLAEVNAKESALRLERQQENANAAAKARDRLVSDLARLRDAERLHGDQVDTLERIARGAGAADSAAAAARQAADAAVGMLADMQRRTRAFAGAVSQHADASRIAGAQCERDYDALIGAERR